MTEEEYFRKNFPDSCYGDKPLSPHWDYFQYGVEFGERESEKRIEELEESLEKLQKSTFNMIDEKNNRITDLEKENAELKEELKKWKDGITLKDEEIGCIETDFNTFKSKAKEIIVTFLGLMQTFGYSPSTDKFISEAEQFLKDSEVEK